MSWRTVVISRRCKLDLKLGYLVVRGNETRRIFLDEIAMLIIEDPAVSMTGCLLKALTEKKIRVIFCDSSHSPTAELVPLYGAHDTTRKLRQQLEWNDETKGGVWDLVVGEKIRLQAEHLRSNGLVQEAELLDSYIPQIEFQDSTNREGHAAKVYFNALFGKDFSRSADLPINAALNYGYSILLSAFNREISAAGYRTELGIHHNNVFNHFNLSSDLMEPFRILVDRIVCEIKPESWDKDTRYQMIGVLNEYVEIDHKNQTVLNAIHIYLTHIFEALNNGDPSLIHFYSL